MLAIKRLPRQVSHVSKAFSTTARRMVEKDDVGSGGSSGGDAFSKREKGNEDYYMRQKERERLVALRESLKKQSDDLDKLEKSINESEKK